MAPPQGNLTESSMPSSRITWLVQGLVAAAVLAAAMPVWTQQKPLQLSGEVVTGYATTGSTDGSSISRSVSPFGLFFDVNTYLGHPDFLSFRVQPRVNFGGEAPQAGFDGRDGIRLTTTFLRRRPFPLTITYSNFRTDSISFGSLLGLNAVRQKTRYSDFGVNWQINDRRLPRLVFFYNRNDSESRPGIDALPATTADSSAFGVRGSKHIRGWDVDGEWSHSRRTTDTASAFAPDLTTLFFRQKVTDGHVAARRSFWKQSSISLMAGHQTSENKLDQVPFDQSRSFFHAASTLQLSNRWNTQLQFGYDSNVNDIFDPALGPLPPGTATPILQTGLSTLTASGQTQYKVSRDWTIHGGLSRTRVRSRFAADPMFDGGAWGANGGVGFSRAFHWGQLSAGYSASLTHSTFENNGNSSDTLGHSLHLQYRRGTLESLEFTALTALSLNRVESNVFLTQKNAFADVSVARRFGSYVLRGGLAYQDVRSEDYFDFRSRDWGLRVSVENNFFNLGYTRNAIDGRSLVLATANTTVANPALSGLPLQTVLTTSARQSATVSVRPWKKLQVRTTWFQLDQSLAERLRTDSDFLDLSVLYRFRLLDFEVGYTLFNENVAGFNGVSRQSFFFRVRRSFRIF